MEKVERYEVGTGRKSRRGCGEVVRADDYDALEAHMKSVEGERDEARRMFGGLMAYNSEGKDAKRLEAAEAKIDAVREMLQAELDRRGGCASPLIIKLREIVK